MAEYKSQYTGAEIDAGIAEVGALSEKVKEIDDRISGSDKRIISNRILIENATQFVGMSVYGNTVKPTSTTLEAFGQKYGEIILRVKGKNLLEIPYKRMDTYTNLGITYKVNPDYSIHLSGTSTQNNTIYYNLSENKYMLSRNYFTLTGLVGNGETTSEAGNGFAARDLQLQNLYGVNDKFIVFVGVPKLATIDKVFYPQLEFGNAATDYEPPVQAQEIIISTPNGLRGIPVASADNFTYVDSSSQRWIADEIDFKRGVLIQRIGQIDSYAGETISTPWLSSTDSLSTGATVQYALDTPVETALPESIVNAYKMLTPNEGFTSVYVMDGFGFAYQLVEYVAENKLTVDDVDKQIQNAIAFDATPYGVPVLYLEGDTSGMTKDNAVGLAYRYSGKSGTCTVKWQGSSSLSWEKKNYTIKFDNAFEAATGWGAQSKYCFKANFIDHSHARNVVSAKLWGQVVKSRTTANATLNALPNAGAVDGFPCVIILNGKFHGLYTWNIPKDGWMFGMSDSTLQQAILCADGYSPGTTFTGDATLNGDFDLEYVANEDSDSWVLTSLNRLINAVASSNGSNLDSTIAQYLDWDSAIDYYILTVLLGGSDMIDKNYLLATYDGTKWFFSAYDMDTSYGLHWDGKSLTAATGRVTFADVASGNRVMHLIRNHKTAQLKARYTALRSGVLSEDNVYLAFSNFAAGIPRALLEEDVRKWPTIPSSSVSNTAQILNWYRMRVAAMDKEIESM